MRNYRIRENTNGTCVIEVQKRFLWSLGIKIWREVNTLGDAFSEFSQIDHRINSSLTLDEAKRMVEEWKRGDIYHYPETFPLRSSVVEIPNDFKYNWIIK